MPEIRTRIAARGRIALPAEYRRSLGLRIGDEVILRLEDGEVRIMTAQQAVQRAQAFIRESVPEGRSLADELIAERQVESSAPPDS